jgi:pyruvate/2-oxoacid:ferredoxin oxidoreductase alpha subunit
MMRLVRLMRPKVTIDGNEPAAFVAHKINKVIAIYPITPSSPMGEWSDQWSGEGKAILGGTAQNPDVYLQAREAANSYYLACPAIVQNAMDTFAKQTGRQYHLFDYFGAAEAERVLILIGSGAEAAEGG